MKRYQACLDWAQTDDKFDQPETKEASFVSAAQSCMSIARYACNSYFTAGMTLNMLPLLRLRNATAGTEMMGWLCL